MSCTDSDLYTAGNEYSAIDNIVSSLTALASVG